MVSDFVKERVAAIETKADFDRYIERVRRSGGTIEQKDEIIAYARRQHPIFDEADRTPTKDLLEDIRAGQADIDDITGF